MDFFCGFMAETSDISDSSRISKDQPTESEISSHTANRVNI